MTKLAAILFLAASAVGSTPAAADMTSMVTSKVDSYKSTHPFMGAVVVVVDHGSYYWYQYGNRSATDFMYVYTPIPIASNTKTFVGASLALGDHYNSIDLDDELHTFVSIPTSSPPYHATLGDLASYWSGLPRDMPTVPANATGLYNTLDNCSCFSDPCVAPETAGIYSNYGYAVLGNVLADHAGYATWADMNAAQITTPLGMDKTCTRGDGCHPSFSTSHAHPYGFGGVEQSLPDYSDVTAPGGGLWSTGQDMAIWMRYQLGQISGTTPALARLNAVLGDQRSKIHGSTGYSWKFSSLAFADGTSSEVRWKLGRYAGFNSYLGIADSRQTAVFVFVNRDGSDPDIEDPSVVLKTDLAEKIFKQL